MDALLEDAVLYRSAQEVAYGKWIKEEQRIVESLSALLFFRVEQQTPCVLSLLREYRSTKKIKKKHIEEALVAIEKFHFLFTAVTSQRSSGGTYAMYASLGRRLFEAKDTQAAATVITELKQKLRERVPSSEEFNALFPNIIYTESFTKQRKLIKYILSRLHSSNPSPTAVDYDQMTIEHLAPQSQIGTAGLTDGVVGQVGNLPLVSNDLNGRLKNKDFKDKKQILKDSNYLIPEEIDQSQTWSAKEIEARTKALSIRSYTSVWKI